MIKPDLSVIVVSYNTKSILKACLASLYQYTPINLEVIVVDNNSTDGSPEMVKKYFPEVRLLINKENKGFGGANNQGVKIAKANHLLLLNSDTLIFDDSIIRTLTFAQHQEGLGAISCQLLNKDKTIQPSGGFFPTLLNLFTWQFFFDDLPLLGSIISSIVRPVHPHLNFYARNPKKIDWVTGAFTLIPSKVYNQVAGFDEKIFMYAEELELCYRIARKHSIFFFPEAAIIHLGGKSGGSQLALLSEIRGIKYFFYKHRPKWQLPLISLLFFLGSLLRYLIFGIILGHEEKRQTYLQALSLSLT